MSPSRRCPGPRMGRHWSMPMTLTPMGTARARQSREKSSYVLRWSCRSSPSHSSSTSPSSSTKVGRFSHAAARGKHKTAAPPWLKSMSMSGRQNLPFCCSTASRHALAHTSRDEALVLARIERPIGSRRRRGRLEASICTACSGMVCECGSLTAKLPAASANSSGTIGSKRWANQSRTSRTLWRVVCHSLYDDHQRVASWEGLGTSSGPSMSGENGQKGQLGVVHRTTHALLLVEVVLLVLLVVADEAG